ncbi:MAG: EFR1 family ferrodoxin [Clostridia bacterium]|nr:EFR1 family ferrodoxin [Clostridia bacterium]
MKSVVVCYFSGTGNTELVANMIKEEFSQLQYTVDLVRMEDVLNHHLNIDLGKYDFIGIGSQVIGYGAPKIVYDFIRALPKGNGKKVFVFRTAGGVAPINYNASKWMLRKLTKKGYDAFHERLFSIGSNWVVRFDSDVMRQLYDATKKKVGIMCREIILGEKRILRTDWGLKMRMELVELFFTRALRWMAKDYSVKKTCTHCGQCIKNCPSRNIIEKNKKIKFGFNCNGCMRCYYICPKNAINFRIYKFFPVAGGYNAKKIFTQSGSEIEKIPGFTPPFLDNYLKNDSL